MSAALCMQVTGRDFLAGAGLADEQNSGVAAGKLVELLAKRPGSATQKQRRCHTWTRNVGRSVQAVHGNYDGHRWIQANGTRYRSGCCKNLTAVRLRASNSNFS